MSSTALSVSPQALPFTFAAIAFLANLRQAVIEHSDHRMPKCKFRVSLKLILQLQPGTRLISAGSTLQLFVGEALLADGFLSAAMFKSAVALHDSNLNWWRVKFALTTPVVPSPGQLSGMSESDYAEQYRNPVWTYQHCGGGWKGGAGREIYDQLKTRVASLFLGDFFAGVDASKLLFPHCLICGRALTDPASMVRFVGPECAGTSSLVVPHLINKPSTATRGNDHAAS
jgi:hypothetical protein